MSSRLYLFSAEQIFGTAVYHHCIYRRLLLRTRGRIEISHPITMTSVWAWWRLKSLSLRLFTQPFIQAKTKKNHQISAPLAFVKGIHRWPGIARTKGQYRGKCFHLMTLSCLGCWLESMRWSWSTPQHGALRGSLRSFPVSIYEKMSLIILRVPISHIPTSSSNNEVRLK